MRTSRFMLLTGLVLVILLVLRYGSFFYAFYALVLVIIVSQITGRYGLTGLDHERVCNKIKARIGETVTVSTEVHNSKPMPVLWVLLEDLIPEGLPKDGENAKAVLLRPFQRLRLQYTVTCAYRGYHRLGPLMMETGDLFGLVRRFKLGKSAHYVTVYPHVVRISRYEIATRRPIGEVPVSVRIYEDPTRMVGVRQYQRGDPLNRIHWRATAKTGELHSKVYEPSTMLGANIVLDFNKSAWSGEYSFQRSELGATAAASIAAYIIEQKQQVGLISNGVDGAERALMEQEEREAGSRSEMRRLALTQEKVERLRPVEVRPQKGGANLLEIMETIARLELADGLPAAELLRAEYTRLPRDAALLLIVPSVPPSLVQMIARLKTSGFVVVVFLILNHDEVQLTRARLAQENVPVFHIEREKDLDVLSVRVI